MMMYSNRKTALIAALMVGSFGLTACASMSNKERGAVVGAGTGGAVGGVIGNNTGLGTARGAIIGAVIGGAAGAVIGHQMDQQAKEIDQTVPGAEVERVGEGIQITFDSGLLFDFDSDRIRSDAAANLDNLASNLVKFPGSDLLIVGHTDSRGEDAYNMNLSLRRANAASAYLIARGVPAARIRTSGRGEMEPVATNATDAGMQQNRRVEIAIYASEAYRNQVKSNSGN